MEKKEKKADLEQLLNSLVKAGWKPYGISRVKNVTLLNRYVSFSKRTILGIEFFEYTLRSLASKESGLWQFVCENGMINANDTPEENVVNYWRYNKKDLTEWWYMRNYQFRLIESSLKDESELEEFLLQNINVGND